MTELQQPTRDGGEPNCAMWIDEIYIAAQRKNGVTDDKLFPGIIQLFDSSRQGWYIVTEDGKRVGESEWHPFEDYVKQIEAAAPAVGQNYPAVRELANLHLENVLTIGKNPKYIGAAHCCGLATDESVRGKGYAKLLMAKTIQTLKEEGYKYFLVETTGNGSRAIIEKLQGVKVTQFPATPYNAEAGIGPDDRGEIPQFRVFEVEL
jgi:GNAT superfamily N-acetyltransferase